ncbi:MAG: MerR family transcriptional regulator [Gaiellaceae bacterium]
MSGLAPDRTRVLLQIGTFSRLSGLTIATLRYYDRVGLLQPASIDSRTGYRRYEIEQVVHAQLIARLRHWGVSVPEIAGALAGGEAAIEATVARRRQAVTKERDRLGRLLAEIDEALEGGGLIVGKSDSITYELACRHLSRQTVASQRTLVPSGEVEAFVRAAFAELMGTLQRAAISVIDGVFTIQAPADEHDNVDVEVAVPVAPPRATDVELGEALGFHAVVATGFTPETPRMNVYRALAAWLDEAGARSSDRLIEFYSLRTEPVPEVGEVVSIAWEIDQIPPQETEETFFRPINPIPT